MIAEIHHVFPGISARQFQKILACTSPRDEIRFHEGGYEQGAIFIPHDMGLTITGIIKGGLNELS